MIEQGKRILKNAVAAVLRTVQKKAGLHIYRKVGNAEKWAAWLAASGVPDAKTADELRVTVMTVVGEVQVIPEQFDQVVYATSGVFCRIGGKLAFAWYGYGYYDRHWAIREITGCEVCCHSRAVLILSDNPGDFEFSDEALLAAPHSLVLDGESTEPLADDAVEITKSAGADLFTPTADTVAKAKAALRSSLEDAGADPMQQAALEDLTHGKPVSKALILEDLGADMAAEIGVEGVAKTAPKTTDTRKTTDVSPSRQIEVLKRDASRQTIYGWASVSTVDGELYEDLHGDTIAVEAQYDICEGVVKSGNNLGGVEHGETPNVLTAAMVIDDAFADAMTDNFYFGEDGRLKTKKQGTVIGYHIPDKDRWEAVKDQSIEFSINATAYIQ